MRRKKERKKSHDVQCPRRKKLDNSSFKAMSTLALLSSLELTNGAFRQLSTGIKKILIYYKHVLQSCSIASVTSCICSMSSLKSLPGRIL